MEVIGLALELFKQKNLNHDQVLRAYLAVIDLIKRNDLWLGCQFDKEISKIR